MESEVATTRVDARVTAGVYQSLGLLLAVAPTLFAPALAC